MVGLETCVGERKGAYRGLVWKPEGKRLLRRSRFRWKMILEWIFRKLNGGMDWIDMAQNRDR